MQAPVHPGPHHLGFRVEDGGYVEGLGQLRPLADQRPEQMQAPVHPGLHHEQQQAAPQDQHPEQAPAGCSHIIKVDPATLRGPRRSLQSELACLADPKAQPCSWPVVFPQSTPVAAVAVFPRHPFISPDSSRSAAVSSSGTTAVSCESSPIASSMIWSISKILG